MSGATIYNVESLDAFLGDALPLLEKHWRETAHYPDIPLDPNFDAYRRIEAQGLLRIFTVRVDGALCGYAVFIVAPNAHYRTSFQATQEALFIDSDHRPFGMSMLMYSENKLRLEGAQVIYHRVKVEDAALGVLLQRMGYEVVDTVYARRLS